MVVTELETEQHVMDGDEVEALFKAMGEDMGFEHPLSYLKERFSAYYTKGILPKAGGLDDQDASFIRDLHRAFLIKRYQFWKITQGGGSKPKSRDAKPKAKPDWQDVL